PFLYAALGGRDEVLTNALRYSNLVFGAAVLIWITNLLAAALRGAGNVRVPALLTAVGAVMTLAFSPLLIFGWGPVPRFGVAGAGYAMILYYAIATTALIVYLRSTHAPVRLIRTRIEWRLLKDILGVGILSAIGTVVANLTVVLATGYVGRFGGTAICGLRHWITPRLRSDPTLVRAWHRFAHDGGYERRCGTNATGTADRVDCGI